MYRIYFLVFLVFQFVSSQNEKILFQPIDVIELECASNPQISSDVLHIVYRRNSFDIMTDKSKGNLWILN